MPVKCLIVDQLHESICPLLDGVGIKYDYRPDITRDEIKKVIANYNGLIIRSKTRVDKDLLGKSALKFVARAGAGIDILDQSFIKKAGIKIINSPEGNRDAVGEHTIALILNILNNITRSHKQVVENIWDRAGNRGEELGSLTVGIIGYGNTGSSLAKKLSGFGCKVIAYDKYLEVISDANAQQVDILTLYKQTNILSLHLPLTNETRALASASFFRKFENLLIFINTSRGEIAPLADLRSALENGNVQNVGLDVLECEKLDKMSGEQIADFNWLKESGKVLFTPHVAGLTKESYVRINEVLVEKIGAFLDHGSY